MNLPYSEYLQIGLFLLSAIILFLFAIESLGEEFLNLATESFRKIVSKVAPILNCLTLNLVPSETKQEILITLPETVDEETKNKIIYRLERKKFHVTRVDSRLPEPREFEYESKSY